MYIITIFFLHLPYMFLKKKLMSLNVIFTIGRWSSWWKIFNKNKIIISLLSTNCEVLLFLNLHDNIYKQKIYTRHYDGWNRITCIRCSESEGNFYTIIRILLYEKIHVSCVQIDNWMTYFRLSKISYNFEAQSARTKFW